MVFMLCVMHRQVIWCHSRRLMMAPLLEVFSMPSSGRMIISFLAILWIMLSIVSVITIRILVVFLVRTNIRSLLSMLRPSWLSPSLLREGVMTLPKFDTQFSPRSRFCQAPGCRIHRLYQSKLSDDGTIELVDAGSEDIYDSIQSHKDSTDIHVLLKRFQQGDVDALSKVQGAYGDFTEMPKTYADALNAMIAGEQFFNSLPLETREKFDFSLHKFILAMDDWPSFSAALGIEQSAAQSVEEVKQVEQEQ